MHSNHALTTRVDDSGSMQFEEEGSRIKDLRLILERVSFAATLFDADGISLRFMNTDLSGMRDQQGRPLQDGVSNEAQMEQNHAWCSIQRPDTNGYISEKEGYR